MARSIAEQSNRLSIFWLKKQGYLPQIEKMSSATVSWSYGGASRSSIGIYVVAGRESGNYMQLEYTQTNRWTGEKEDMDYKVSLLTTPCRYGGVRYWFQCPLIKNGYHCERRVGVLYNGGKYFGCRYCCRIAYQGQFEGGRYRTGSLSEVDVEKALGEVRREYYNGKPTRRFRRYLRLRERMNHTWIVAGMRFGTNW